MLRLLLLLCVAAISAIGSAQAVAATPVTLTFSSGNIAVPIPDGDLLGVDLGVEIPIDVPDMGTFDAVKVRFRIDHEWDGDLRIDLVHPDHTLINLVNGGAYGVDFGSGANDCSGTPTVIDDSAVTLISDGTAPFAGSFKPEEPRPPSWPALAAVAGKPAKGTWKLRVVDSSPVDTGTIGCVTLEFHKTATGAAKIVPWIPVTLSAENAVPPNGAPDPGETLTVSFPLINLGNSPTTNVVATLQATGGVSNPSAAQSYGALAIGGPAVTRSFTFTASGACGNTITPTFALQDGATNLGTISFAMRLGVTQPGAPQAFSNGTPILVPAGQPGSTSGKATPYPSNITVSGIAGTIRALTVNLNHFSHTFPPDVDVLLVSPTGQKMIIMSYVGSGVDAVNADLIFDDAAAAPLPDNVVVSGTYLPTSNDSDDPVFGSPAPARPYLNAPDVGNETLARAYAGENPNGVWKLYVIDNADEDVGQFSGGWGISIVPESPSCSVLPTVPGAPTAVAATAGNTQASVSFTAPANNGGSTITGYTATCTPTVGTPVAASGAASPIVVAGLTNGVTYTCTVHATNGVGNGPESSPSNPVTPSGTTAALTVSLSGSGTGTVASNIAGINCPGDCSEAYPAGAPVILTAAATGGSVFTGWLGGGCTGTSVTCNVAVDTATAVSATFAAPGTVATLDIDLSAPGTKYDALTDGLLIIRDLRGLSDALLTTGALGATAARTTPTAIASYLTDIKPYLDVDGNGQADAPTDGVLIIRYLFGLRGDPLIAGAFDPLGTRTTAGAIEGYLQTLLP